MTQTKKQGISITIAGVVVLLAGLICFWQFRAASNLAFALSLIGVIVGAVITFSGLAVLRAKQERKIDTKKLVLAAMMAALCYIGFSYFKIDITVAGVSTAFHLGNVFCVLGALLLGGVWGGLAGAVGMTIGDLMFPAYVVSAPKTFLLKLGIGLIVGLVAHKGFKLSRASDPKKVTIATVVSSVAGMAFNIVADPVVGYFYKTYLLGVPQDAANIWVKIGAVTTAVNAVIAVIVASIAYLALRPAMKKAKLFPEV